MGVPSVELSSEWDRELDAFLADRVYEFNVEATGLADGIALVGVVKDAVGGVVAALSGHTWGGTCQVNHLWVDASQRGRGWGRALLEAAEVEARRRSCEQIVLLTHSFQAPAFYEQLGYLRQATIANYPKGHAQLVYVKLLESAEPKPSADES